MTPNLRRALHQALDLVLDAMSEDARAKPIKKRRVYNPPPLPDISKVDPRVVEEVKARIERQGWKKAG